MEKKIKEHRKPVKMKIQQSTHTHTQMHSTIQGNQKVGTRSGTYEKTKDLNAKS